MRHWPAPSIGSPKTAKQRLGEVFRKYGDLAGELGVEMHGTKISAGHTVQKIGEKLCMVTLEEQRDRIGGMLKDAEKRIVVFVDDIDRLDRKEAQAVFRLLKLTADFPYVSYVLAFDRDVVAAAIGEQYGAGNIRSGHHYLEKIGSCPNSAISVRRAAAGERSRDRWPR